MADNLFEGLPPPSRRQEEREPEQEQEQPHQRSKTATTSGGSSSPVPAPKPVLKSALKRSEPTESKPEASVPEKRLRFKTTTDASEKQVIEAMQKIASHIKNPSKFGKASKLAIQLIQAGSVKPGTSDHFVAILEAAMSSSTSCTDPSVRADYHALFSAAQDARECLNKKQKNQLTTWMIRAVDANDLHTDDSFVGFYDQTQVLFRCCISFGWKGEEPLVIDERAELHAVSSERSKDQVLGLVSVNLLTAEEFTTVQIDKRLPMFSKTAGRIKEAISNLPVAAEDDDREEAAALKDETELTDEDGQTKHEMPLVAPSEENEEEEESDPFGLDAFMSSSVNKGGKTKEKKDAAARMKEEVEENKRFIRSQREALITCLEIAARRYKTPWCQTVIDILVKQAFDNVGRFTSRQRDAIEKLWASIREQHARRKQGKSVTGKLDVNAFEWLQQKYSTEKISIRHSVGASGDRRAQQWLG